MVIICVLYLDCVSVHVDTTEDAHKPRNYGKHVLRHSTASSESVQQVVVPAEPSVHALVKGLLVERLPRRVKTLEPVC